MCKHLAATLYGVGARLDEEPELLFTLRDVDHLELLDQAVGSANLDQALRGDRDGALAGENLGELFGIELESAAAAPSNGVSNGAANGEVATAPASPPKRRRAARAAGTTTSAKPAAVKKTKTAGKSANVRSAARKNSPRKKPSAKQPPTKQPLRRKTRADIG
jgi:uncharacterized Zn finger protein